MCNHLSLFLCVADYDKLLPGEAALECHGLHHRTNDELCMGLSQTVQADSYLCSRVEPLCTIHHRCGEQGPKEVKVLRYGCTAGDLAGDDWYAGFLKGLELISGAQTHCTDSARRSMTGAGRSSWS